MTVGGGDGAGAGAGSGIGCPGVGAAPGVAGAVVVGAVTYPIALRALRALTVEDLDRTRILVERLPARTRASGLVVAGFLCRGPLPEPWSPSR